MYCTKCGFKIEDDTKFCPKCGTKLEKAQNELPNSQPNQIENNDSEESNEKIIEVNTSYYLKRHARNIITKFYINGQNIRCEQDDSLFKKEPKKVYYFTLDDIMTCERKWIMYTDWLIKIRLAAAIIITVLGLVFSPLLSLGLLLLLINFIWIYNRAYRITLKSGEQINVYCNRYSQIEEIEEILKGKNK